MLFQDGIDIALLVFIILITILVVSKKPVQMDVIIFFQKLQDFRLCL